MSVSARGGHPPQEAGIKLTNTTTANHKVRDIKDRGTKYNKNSNKGRKLDRAVAGFKCMDHVTVYTVEKRGFQQKPQQFNPQIQVTGQRLFHIYRDPQNKH